MKATSDDCAECTESAVHGPVHFWHLWRVLVGRVVYAFLDHHRNLHLHRTDPRLGPYAPYVAPGRDWSSYLETHAVFRLRIGGLFRRNRIYGKGSNDWRITKCWDGHDLTIRDWHDNAVTSLSSGVSSIVEFLDIVPAYGSLADLWRESRRPETLVATRHYVEVQELRRQRDELGIGISVIVSKMIENGNSNNPDDVQEWRIRIQEVLESVSRRLSRAWLKESWNRRVDERRKKGLRT